MLNLQIGNPGNIGGNELPWPRHIKLNLQMRVSWWLTFQQAAWMFDDAT